MAVRTADNVIVTQVRRTADGEARFGTRSGIQLVSRKGNPTLFDGVIRTVTETKTVMEVSGSEVHFDDGSSISLPAEVAKKFQVGDVTQVRLLLRRTDRD